MSIETYLPSLAEILLSCGEVSNIFFFLSLKSLCLELTPNLPLPAPGTPFPCAQAEVKELPTPHGIYGAEEVQERGGVSTCPP